ncbi:DegT/DnrJ/EryC1/StrS family aminotransferase [Saliphagus infecundisoli]|uniref:DegT/DnrJ/EryC1/StrS family aminotransferase n=1 Tax=Saliphagus infecundisoli TaxID=1849069 RepID=A0ABD5QIS7_9EURY
MRGRPSRHARRRRARTRAGASRPAGGTEPTRMSRVPIADPDLGAAAVDRVSGVVQSGHLADGPEVRSFESAFADYCGTAHGVGTSNGTTALVAALHALGVGEDDCVVTPSFSFIASANAVRLAGATPVFADVDPATYTLDPASVRAVVEAREDIVGLLPVHLYGLPAPMAELGEIADDHDLFVVEDACQAHGAAIDGDRVGSLGDAACFSFYPTKNMTTGEGGMITTDRGEVAERAASYVNHGRSPDAGYDHARLGHNHRMTSLAAAIGLAQLERLPAFNEARRENAAWYDDRLAEFPVETPSVPEGYRHVYHQYTVACEDRDALAESLEEAGVGCGVYYPTPIHRQPAYEDVAAADVSLPATDRAADRVLSVPVHPGLSEADRRTVREALSTHYS